MKINFDIKKGTEAVSDFFEKTSDMGKRAIADVQQNSIALSEKMKQDSYLRRLKKYNPVFPDAYNSTTFNTPNMIIIVDDAVRRGIDVCEGSIGWLSNEGGMEVFHLYDEAVPVSGLQFIPSAECDATYYVDNFNRNRFIKLECIFSKAHEERLAELKHIAHSLGAKSCTIEISESSSEVNISKKKAAIQANAAVHGIGASSTESAEQNASYKSTTHRSGKITAQFEGSDTPKKPKLKWFVHDDNIKHLIDMRCKGINTVKAETLILSGNSSATMSAKTACSIDNAISKMKVKGSSTMESQVMKENQSTLIFCVEF